jgi:hypothetical protein
MSASVSELKFWKKGADPNLDNTGDGGAEFLSYNVFLGLSVLGGYFGLDHLYLRSPLTFVAKLLVNVLCFGVWWLYDASQAIFNTDIIKIYGLGVPGLGPKGIASGVLASDTPGKNHLRFLIYSLCLFFGGVIGLDSFVVGDQQSGIIRLLCCVTVILLPVSMAWWAYKLFTYFFSTKTIITKHSKFFGGIGGDNQDSFIDAWIKQRLKPIETVLAPLSGFIELGNKTLDKVSMLSEQAHGIVEAVSSASTLSAVKSIHGATSDGVKAAMATSSTPSVADNAAGAEKTEKTEKTEKEEKQVGGYQLSNNNLNGLSYILIATLAFISLAGFCKTVYRTSIKNVRTPNDDAPPEPRVPRKSDSKKQAA